VVFSRAGVFLHSFGLHLKMEANIAIAIEASPLDMIKAMRYSAILGKMAEGARLAVTARDVFNAATLNGAKALGRDDLGRLAPGAKADIIIVDLPPAADHPIKALVYMANQQDIKTVIVDGKVLVEGGRMLEVDEEELARKASEVTQRQKMAVVGQNPMGLSADEFFPPSFPME
jgi:cytosine/adenosine deaminase-related metal-dependent hydrolase